MKKIYINISIFSLLALGLISCLDIQEIPFIELNARFLPSATLVQLGTPITFNQQSSSVASQFSWDFGDGNTSTEESPVYTYDTVGTYSVTLRSTKADGISSDSITQSILVIPDTDSASNAITFGENLSEEVGFSFARYLNGYMLAGRENLNTIQLIRLDNDRNVMWTQRFNNFANGRGQIFIKDITATVDRGAIITGYYEYNINDSDGFVLKVDENGNEQWKQLFDTQREERFNRVLEINDRFLIAGTISDVSSSGNRTPSLIIWTLANNGDPEDVIFNGSNWEANDFTFTFDGGFAVALSEGNRPRIFVFDPTFSEVEIFVPMLNGAAFEGRANGITQSENGDLILVGERTFDDERGNPSDSTDAFIVSFDEFGTQQWIDIRSYYSEGYQEVIETTDGSIVAVGTHENPLSGKDILVGRYSPDGTNIQVKLIGGSQDDEGFSIRPEINGEFSILGSTKSFGNGLRDFYFLRLNTSLE